MGLFGQTPGNDGEQKTGGRGTQTPGRMGLMAVVAAYIIYLGVGLLRSYFQGEGGIPAWASIVFGFGFIAFGVGYLFILLQQYRAYQARSAEEAAEDPAEITEEEHEAAETSEEQNQTERSGETGTDAAEAPIEDKE